MSPGVALDSDNRLESRFLERARPSVAMVAASYIMVPFSEGATQYIEGQFHIRACSHEHSSHLKWTECRLYHFRFRGGAWHCLDSFNNDNNNVCVCVYRVCMFLFNWQLVKLECLMTNNSTQKYARVTVSPWDQMSIKSRQSHWDTEPSRRGGENCWKIYSRINIDEFYLLPLRSW